jgi:hypothetical protein
MTAALACVAVLAAAVSLAVAHQRDLSEAPERRGFYVGLSTAAALFAAAYLIALVT